MKRYLAVAASFLLLQTALHVIEAYGLFASPSWYVLMCLPQAFVAFLAGFLLGREPYSYLKVYILYIASDSLVYLLASWFFEKTISFDTMTVIVTLGFVQKNGGGFHFVTSLAVLYFLFWFWIGKGFGVGYGDIETYKLRDGK